jgi:hypothetical protein
MGYEYRILSDVYAHMLLRNFNRRGSPQGRPLVSVDLRTDEISATGGHRFFVRIHKKLC